MTAYVLLYVTFENNKNNIQRPQISSINIQYIDSNLDNISNELLTHSSKWITDEIGRNNYVETIDETKALADLPDGLIRRYASLTLDPKEMYFELNKPLTGALKQINIFRKHSSNGKIFGRWIDLEIIRSYAIFQGPCNEFSLATTSNITTRHEQIKLNIPVFDNVINELKKFRISSLRKASLRDAPLPDSESASTDTESDTSSDTSSETTESDDTSSETTSDESDDTSSETSSETTSQSDDDVSSGEVEVIVSEKCGDFELLEAIEETVPTRIPPPPPMPTQTKWRNAVVIKRKLD